MRTLDFYLYLALMLMLGQILHADDCKIEPELLEEMEAGSTANVVVFFVNRNKPAIAWAMKNPTPDHPGLRHKTLMDEFRDYSTEIQTGVIQILTSRRKRNAESPGFSDYKQYWLGNKLFIAEAELAALKEICTDPKVEIIRQEPIAVIPDFELVGEIYDVEDANFMEGNEDIPQALQEGLYGHTLAQVKDVWMNYPSTGDGARVASIDTGVQASHEALADNFVGTDYGWFDALDGISEPGNFGLHGTVSMGIFVGTRGMGVSPDATWMTCRACNDDLYCTGEAILDCFQFLTCPTLPDGTEEQCWRRPQIVSIPWNIKRGDDFFEDEITAWRYFYIVPVFNVGMAGPGCESTNSPGEYTFNTIGVGAVDKNDILYEKSGIGNASHGGIKPDIVAPGVEITSAATSSDTGYGVYTGTSLAGAFVAGVLALMQAKHTHFVWDNFQWHVTTKADTTVGLSPDVMYCGEGSIDTYPNIYCGYGRINAWKAINI